MAFTAFTSFKVKEFTELKYIKCVDYEKILKRLRKFAKTVKYLINAPMLQ